MAFKRCWRHFLLPFSFFLLPWRSRVVKRLLPQSPSRLRKRKDDGL